MNSHDWKVLILRVRHRETSEARHESGRRGSLGVESEGETGQEFFLVSRHPQVFDGSSTGFPQ
jgi:hypothetical protein